MLIHIWDFIANKQPFTLADNTPGGFVYTLDKSFFDTATRTIQRSTVTVDWYFGEPDEPQSFSWDGEFWHECVPYTTTRLGYVHDNNGGFTLDVDDEAAECGFDPSGVCSLQLTGTVDGFTATGVATGAHGAVTYSLSAGLTSQAAPQFTALTEGNYLMTAFDGGLAGCRATWGFTIGTPTTPPPVVAPPNVPGALDWSQHPRWHSVAAPAGTEVVLELYVEGQHYQGDFRLVVTLRQRAGTDGQVAFRLDALLHRQLTAWVPRLDAAGTVAARSCIRNYFVRTARLSASSGLPGAWTLSAVRTVLRGGLPVARRDTAWPVAAEDGSWPFLTWQPRGKRVTAAQPEYWSWLCPAGTPGAVVVRRRYQLPGGLPPLTTSEAVVVAAGGSTTYRLLGVPLLAGAVAQATAVTLWLEDAAGTVLSEVVDFALEAAPLRPRYYLFTNSVGGCDTLRTSGRLEATLDTKEELAEHVPAPGAPARAAQVTVLSAEASDRRKVNTGYLTQAEWAWLQELVLSRERWEAQGPRLLPLVWAKGSLAYVRDERPLAGFTFEYEYAFPTTAYAHPPDA